MPTPTPAPDARGLRGVQPAAADGERDVEPEARNAGESGLHIEGVVFVCLFLPLGGVAFCKGTKILCDIKKEVGHIKTGRDFLSFLPSG